MNLLYGFWISSELQFNFHAFCISGYIKGHCTVYNVHHHTLLVAFCAQLFCRQLNYTLKIVFGNWTNMCSCAVVQCPGVWATERCYFIISVLILNRFRVFDCHYIYYYILASASASANAVCSNSVYYKLQHWHPRPNTCKFTFNTPFKAFYEKSIVLFEQLCRIMKFFYHPGSISILLLAFL